MDFFYKGATPFWSEREIALREYAISLISSRVRDTLKDMNRAWEFVRIEGPILTPEEYVSSAYDPDLDVFGLRGGETRVLRAETTASSYLAAQHILKTTKTKLPLCIWQAGKSFRRETSDGATAAKLRFNEFYQLEFQCAYSSSTGADYFSALNEAVRAEIEYLTSRTVRRTARLVDSERIPHYSEKTVDVEIEYNDRWTEMCSMSVRNDFPDEDVVVAEVAVGLDRVVCAAVGIDVR